MRGLSTRILHVVTDSDRRGAQVFACDLDRYLLSRGIETETVALRPGESGKPLNIATLPSGIGFPTQLRMLRGRMGLADVVVAHGSRTLIATALASAGLRQPVVYRQISDLGFWADSMRRRVRVRASLRRMSHVVALWSRSKDVLVNRFRVPAQRVSIIPNGVSQDVFRPATPDERRLARARFNIGRDAAVVLYVGAMVPEKGVDVLVRAVAKLPDVTLLAVGHGHASAALENLAAEVAPGRVTFAGALDDVRPAYSAADMLVHPSLTEQMPGVVIEAGLSGLPIVATRVGAVPTMISDGVSGFLVEPDPTEIADRIERVFERPELGESARAHFLKEYAIDVVGARWLEVLEAEVDVGRSMGKSR